EEDRLRPIREFSLKPREIREYLNRFVIGQEDAKRAMSVAICDHYNHVRRCVEDDSFREREYAKHNVVLLGPTGVGKTYMMRCIAKLVGVPFVKADATKFTETGYVGHDVEDLVRDLVKGADGDVELAEYGMIYLDEIDKIAAQSDTIGKDVSGRGVQINLLKLMEETEASLFSQTDLIGQMQAVMDLQRGRGETRRTINTRHILFIVSGVFDKLADQVRRRVSESRIGFAGDKKKTSPDADFLRMAETRDLVDYGFEPEFVGRLPVRIVCDALGVDDLEQIMVKSEGSILTQYRSDFEGYGIDLTLTREAIHAVAEAAHKENTGARGLMTVLERLFRGFKFELPSTAIKALEVTEEAVADPGAALEAVLKGRQAERHEIVDSEVKAFAAEFERAHGLKLVFSADATAAVEDLSLEEDKSASEICRERFHDFEYALKLISRNTGRTSFNISRRLVDDPSNELSRRIAKSFRNDK
ncbi:AAA family ATPase, partial [Verrucomicrobiota bacterium]